MFPDWRVQTMLSVGVLPERKRVCWQGGGCAARGWRGPCGRHAGCGGAARLGMPQNPTLFGANVW